LVVACPKKRIRKIEYGTVIDHITAGKRPGVIEALKLGRDRTSSMLMNVQSSKLGKKDAVRTEGIHLEPKEIAAKDRIRIRT
jgi:aspartate carbamoyltransferase regulatory subunit